MKVALPVWQGQVSSVFDFAHKLLVIELKNGGETDSQEIVLVEQSGPERAATLKQLGVGVLICGAISRPLAEMINGSGIQVLPFVKGSAEQIMNAYKTGQLSQPQYTMPGFWPGARRSFRRRRCWKGGRR
jgi:predicted Fe-Mo cluster-binding NifX family protein